MTKDLAPTLPDVQFELHGSSSTYREKAKKQKIVVVLGMHRSGTSLLTNLLSVLGVDLGEDLLPGDPGNQQGYWENTSIFKTQDALLNYIAKDWGDYGLAYPYAIDWRKSSEFQDYKESLISIVREQVANAKGIWGFKDPRTCRLLPLWKEIFAELNLEPMYVMAIRDPAVVTDSLRNREGMDPFHSELLWLLHNMDVIREVGSELRIVVDYDRWFTAPREQARAVAEALDLEWPSEDHDLITRVTGTIRSDLRHSKARRPCSLPAVARTYETLKRIAAGGNGLDRFSLKELGATSECLGAALELSAGAGIIAFALGSAELSGGNLEAALEAYARAAQLRPRLAAAHSARASVLRLLGRSKEALESAKKALALNPSDPIAAHLVATIQIFAEQSFDCTQHLTQAQLIRGNPDQLALWQLAMGGSVEKAVFLHPPAEVVFEVPTGAAGRLMTAVTLHPDVWEKPESGGCEFHIRVDGRVAFVMAIDPVNLPADRRWHEITLDIPETSRECHQVHFETRSIGKSNSFRWALWRSPQFVWSAAQGGKHEKLAVQPNS